MTLSVVITTTTVASATFDDWSSACGYGVTAALAEDHDVILIDTDGTEYRIFATLARDNS